MIDYKKVTAKELREFLDGKKLTKAEKKEFYNATHPLVKEKVSKKVFDANGNPIMYEVKNKDGSVKLDANGNTIKRQKIEMVEKQGGKEKRQFSFIDAKIWVAEHYPDDVTNAPNRKAKESKDPFEDWA